MRTLEIALLQSPTVWHDPEANRILFTNAIAELQPEVKLVVLPEMFSTGFTMQTEVAESMDGATVAWMQAMAANSQKVICGSVVIRDRGACFNRFIWAAPGAELIWYDKRHLFRMANEHQHYAAGGDQITVVLEGWRIRLAVCYDLRFPVWLRNQQRRDGHGDLDYDLLLVVANWPAPRQKAWNTLLQARAVENQAYVAGVNIVGVDGNDVAYTGGSAIYAPDGTTVCEQDDNPSVLLGALDRRTLQDFRERFPAWQDADPFTIS